jgi:hypothetical protein
VDTFDGPRLAGGGDGVVLAALAAWAGICGYPFTVDPDGDVDITCGNFSVIGGSDGDYVAFGVVVGDIPRHGWLWPFRYRRRLRNLLGAAHGLGYVYLSPLPRTVFFRDLVLARVVLPVCATNDEALAAGLRWVLSVAAYAQEVIGDA